MGSFEKEQRRLLKLLEESEREDAAINSDSEGESDCLEERQDDSDAEQEIDDDDIEIQQTDVSDESIFIGRNRETRWTRSHGKLSVRKRKENIIIHLPGIKGNARNAKDILECWNLFFSNEMLLDIVKWTNEKLR